MSPRRNSTRCGATSPRGCTATTRARRRSMQPLDRLRYAAPCRSPAPRRAGRRAAHRLAGRECRELADRATRCRARCWPTDRRRAAAGRTELGLARIRHARRLLALPRAVRTPVHPPDVVGERQRHRAPIRASPPPRAMPVGNSWAMAGTRCRRIASRTSAA